MIHFLDALPDLHWMGRLLHFPSTDELVDIFIRLSSALVDPGCEREAETPHRTTEVLR